MGYRPKPSPTSVTGGAPAAFLKNYCPGRWSTKKAANGPEPQPYPRFATGTYIIPPTGGIANASTSAESQVRTVFTTNYINTSESNINAPLRSGYAADATSDRKLCGGSYYGVMDLSGNLWEPCVTTANAAGRSFRGNVGDGILFALAGRANQASCPGIQSTVTTANTAAKFLKATPPASA